MHNDLTLYEDSYHLALLEHYESPLTSTPTGKDFYHAMSAYLLRRLHTSWIPYTPISAPKPGDYLVTTTTLNVPTLAIATFSNYIWTSNATRIRVIAYQPLPQPSNPDIPELLDLARLLETFEYQDAPPNTTRVKSRIVNRFNDYLFHAIKWGDWLSYTPKTSYCQHPFYEKIRLVPGKYLATIMGSNILSVALINYGNNAVLQTPYAFYTYNEELELTPVSSKVRACCPAPEPYNPLIPEKLPDRSTIKINDIFSTHMMFNPKHY